MYLEIFFSFVSSQGGTFTQLQSTYIESWLSAFSKFDQKFNNCTIVNKVFGPLKWGGHNTF